MVARATSVVLLLSLTSAFKISGPLTPHFQNWLARREKTRCCCGNAPRLGLTNTAFAANVQVSSRNGYSADDFARIDQATQGSYGGKVSDDQKVTKTPVIFIHGNSDAALRTSDTLAGWENSIDFFQREGYTSAELYVTSYGDTNALNASTRTHSCATVTRLRRFIEAVKAYTGASMVSIVTHSLGVTLGRKAVKGGKITAPDGGNYGLCNCEGVGAAAGTCNQQNGLWPGDSCGLNVLDCGLAILPWPCDGPKYSAFLTDLNTDIEPEGKRIVSGWSTVDDLVMYGDQVWGRPTSLIPRSTDQKIYSTYTHMETKEETADDQYKWVNHA